MCSLFFSSRGCPNKCIYCNEVQFWTSYRSMSPERIVNEIEYQLKAYPHLSSVYFHDSLINGNIPRLLNMANLIVERQLNISWGSMAVIRKEMDYDVFNILKQSGCHGLAFGLESASEKIMINIGKSLMRDSDINKIAQDSKRANLKCTYNFMFGVPGETDEDFQLTIDWLTNNHDCIAMVAPSTAFFGLVPGTPSWDEAEKNGIIFDPMGDATHWESVDGKNSLPVRLERFENFCKRVKKLQIPSTYPFEELTDRDRILGGYFFAIKEYDKAIKYLESWIEENPADEDAKLKLKLCLSQEEMDSPKYFRTNS